MAFIRGPGLLDFFFHLYHTVLITDRRLILIDQKYIDVSKILQRE